MSGLFAAPPLRIVLEVTSPYGSRTDPITHEEHATHSGIDLHAADGTVAQAVHRGRLFRVDIDHDGLMDGNGNAAWLDVDFPRAVLEQVVGHPIAEVGLKGIRNVVDGVVTVRCCYLHLSKLYPLALQAPPRGHTGPPVVVQAGVPLGETGHTGRADGPHLHFGCYLPDGSTIDPAPLLGLQTVVPTGRRWLHLGMTGPDVAELQAALNTWGASLSDPPPTLAVDASFGPQTDQAVRGLQTLKGLKVDGVVGPQTRRALGLPV
jgi:hypothetical protein